MDSGPPILRDTPFVWRREDGTHALVQTWPTSFNDKFRKTFDIAEGRNPDPEKFQPQAVSEFQAAMVQLFGPAAADCPILFCHKKTENRSPAVVGTSENVLAHIKKHPELMQELTILSIDTEGTGFVADGTEGDGKKFEKHFSLTPGEQCVVYQKVGWDTMGCTKPLDQFLRDAELHRPPTAKEESDSDEEVEQARTTATLSVAQRRSIRTERLSAELPSFMREAKHELHFRATEEAAAPVKANTVRRLSVALPQWIQGGMTNESE